MREREERHRGRGVTRETDRAWRERRERGEGEKAIETE